MVEIPIIAIVPLVAVLISLLLAVFVALIQLKSAFTHSSEAYSQGIDTIVRLVDRIDMRLENDGAEHIKIVEQLAILSRDIRKLDEDVDKIRIYIASDK